jgi:hypothetical protein
MPHTPYLSCSVAGISTALAVGGLASATWSIAGGRAPTANPTAAAHAHLVVGRAAAQLALHEGVRPAVQPLLVWLAEKVDWAFWHDFVHDRVIRDIFVTGAEFSANVLDAQGVDGLVNGAGKAATVGPGAAPVADRLCAHLRAGRAAGRGGAAGLTSCLWRGKSIRN